MSCSPYDLKDFFFGELAAAERSRVEDHLEECPECREEFERLGMTQAALHSLRDEELPRRIAFVSDKVFEPRWWQTLWHSGPRLGFASAAMLAAAIVVHGFARPAPVVLPGPDAAVIESRISAEVARRIEPAVRAAVAESEARQAQKTAEQISTVRKEFELRRDLFAEALSEEQKKNSVLIKAMTEGAHL